MIWCSANRYLPRLQNLFPHRSCRCFINWIPSQCISSVSRILFVLSPTLPSLWMFVNLDIMLLLGKTKSHVILYLIIPLVDTRRIWKLGKSPLLSCRWQLGYVLLHSVLILRSPSCWLLTLWLPLFAIPPSHNACTYATKFVLRENACGLYVQ